MGRRGVTLSDVSKAVNEIESGGEMATIQAIREHLGTGSPNTISMHLASLRKNKDLFTNNDIGISPLILLEIKKEIDKQVFIKTRELRARIVDLELELDCYRKSDETLVSLKAFDSSDI